MKRKSKIKFTAIYQTFSEAEKNEFKLFISSPLYNKDGRNYTAILNGIESDVISDLELSKDKKERTLWNRLSELTKLAEKFIVLKASVPEDFIYELTLLKELRKRNLDGYFEHQITKIKNTVNKSPFSVSKVNNLLELNEMNLKFLHSTGDLKKLALEFQVSGDFRIAAFILELLKQLLTSWEMRYSNMIDSDIYLEEIMGSLDFKKLLSYVKGKLPEVYPKIEFFYHLYNSFRFPLEEQHYKKAKEIFDKDLKFVSEEYRLMLYGFMMEYNFRLLSLQKENSNKELFKLINQKLNEGLCGDIQTKDFTANHFRDYLLVSLALKNFKWAKKFIKEFGPMLPEEMRNASILLGKALLMFHKKNYLKAFELINKVKQTNPIQYVDASLLKLKLNYELEELNECYEELRRLVEYLSKKRLVQIDFVKYTKDFCKSYILLLKLKEEPTRKNFTNLEFELNKGNITGRRWIKEKSIEINKL